MPQTEAPKPDPGPIHEATGWRAPLLWLVALLVRLWWWTLRVENDCSGLRPLQGRPEPATLLLWHNRLFAVPWLVRKVWSERPAYALVSASRDGANLTRFFGYLGVKTVRGSSSRFGREALRELIAVQRAGYDIAITPDGPRGPVYQLKAGAVLAARRTRSPLVLFGVQFANAWRLRSWDRFFVPKPFSKVSVCYEVIASQSLAGGAAGVEQVRQRLLILSGELPEAWPPLREPELGGARES